MPLSPDQLENIDKAKEVLIETSSGGISVKTIIWVVVHEGSVYVRSVDGDAGRWYQRALSNPSVALIVDGERAEFRAIHVDDQDEIDAVTGELRSKYRPGGSLDRMTRAEVLPTTLRLEPVS